MALELAPTESIEPPAAIPTAIWILPDEMVKKIQESSSLRPMNVSNAATLRSFKRDG
jgi:hypothetical protein